VGLVAIERTQAACLPRRFTWLYRGLTFGASAPAGIDPLGEYGR
jgi:hypothetical protein